MTESDYQFEVIGVTGSTEKEAILHIRVTHIESGIYCEGSASKSDIEALEQKMKGEIEKFTLKSFRQERRRR